MPNGETQEAPKLELSEALLGTLALIRKAQERLCAHLHPDSAGDDSECLNDLLTMFDGPEQRRIEARARMALSNAEGAAETTPRSLTELTPTHLQLLKRGARGGYIRLSDNSGIHVGEVAALGELERAGLVEPAKGPFPPRPPSMTPSVITDAGRAALEKEAGDE